MAANYINSIYNDSNIIVSFDRLLVKSTQVRGGLLSIHQGGDSKISLNGGLPKLKSTANAEVFPSWNQQEGVRNQVENSSWRTLAMDEPGDE